MARPHSLSICSLIRIHWNSVLAFTLLVFCLSMGTDTASGIFSLFNANCMMENILCVCLLTRSHPVHTDTQTSSVATHCLLSMYLGVLLTVCSLSCSCNHGHDRTFVSGIEMSSVTFPGKVVSCGETLIYTIFSSFLGYMSVEKCNENIAWSSRLVERGRSFITSAK